MKECMHDDSFEPCKKCSKISLFCFLIVRLFQVQVEFWLNFSWIRILYDFDWIMQDS